MIHPKKESVICIYSYKCNHSGCKHNGIHNRKYHCLRQKCKIPGAKCASVKEILDE